MSKRVIADCGSTKIHWAVVENGVLVSEFFTTGVNPMVMGADMVAGIFGLELPGLHAFWVQVRIPAFMMGRGL